MLLPVTASVHLVAGTDIQRILVFHHTEAAVLERGNSIPSEDADRSFALPALIILYDPNDLYSIVLIRVILSKHKEIIIFAGIKSAKFRKFRLDHFFINKLLIRRIGFYTNILLTNMLNAHESTIVIFLQIGIDNAAFIGTIVLSVYVL